MRKKNLKEWLNEKSEVAKEKIHNGVEWCKNNKEVICVFGPALIGGAIEICKIVAKRSTVNDEKKLKERYIYDRSCGHYWEMSREPSKYEWLQIDQRKTNGESLGEILYDMKLM